MQCRALKTFQSRYGFIRTGEIFTAEEHIGKDYLNRGMVKIEPDRPDRSQLLKPDRTQVLPEAPLKKDEPTPRPPESEKQQEGGQERPSVLSRAARRLRRKTASTPAPAAK